MCLDQIFKFRAYLIENLCLPLTKAQVKATDLSVPRYQVKPNSIGPISDSVFNYILGRSINQSKFLTQ